MAAISIGIDLCRNPLRVGCKFAGAVSVQEGSKGANLKVDGQGKSHQAFGFLKQEIVKGTGDSDFEEFKEQKEVTITPANTKASSPELVQCFEDAREVAKSFFGSSHIKSAVVVVPSDTDGDAWRSVEAAGSKAFIHVLQIIPEHIAVAAAYAHKTNQTKTSTITIISDTAGACKANVVSINPLSGMTYEYEVQHQIQESHHGKPEPKNNPKGIFGSLGKGVISNVNNVAIEGTPITNIFEDLMQSILKKNKSALKKVIFVGKSAELERMREVITQGFTEVKEWNDFEDSEQLAAYGAAEVAYLGKPIYIQEAYV